MTFATTISFDSDRGIRDIFDILQNDDDSDIERTPREMKLKDLNDEDIPERGQLPIRTPGWPRSREQIGSRVRSTVFCVQPQSRQRGGRTVHNARQIDEANGWSYKPIEHLPENPVFKIYVRLCLQLNNIQRNSTVFQSFPRLFWKLQRRNQSLCKSNEGKAS
ncbi:hypothetical protein EVAR_19834_1 [Eumeta japonica]|uniref:Uncharacterized protein n=1 Tax=Eumeta variegata TaxID=151549 RepID=A0A4C1URF2_EUMVA|nr:hypothetical protein EVAR_19834_1 [Eumeta japonica]